ncbi:MAG: hypothetical protein MAGBODY4_01413 [Candidatus Marinimicrobia bacterium]|nr:hypothetical protein [Candidatus Neomarinimicrobiota bacterium]
MSVFPNLKKYHFEIRHLLVLFLILILFQVVLYYIHSSSINNMLQRTMELYRMDSAERLANLTTTSLELVLEMSLAKPEKTPENQQQAIQAFDIILTQQKLQQNVDDICLLFQSGPNTYAIDNGATLYDFIFHGKIPDQQTEVTHAVAIAKYGDLSRQIAQKEEIHSLVQDQHTFQVFVPFVPNGELVGAVYMEITPDFSKIAEAITVMYDETGMVFSILVLLGLLAMFFITVRTVRERDEAQQALFTQRAEQLKREVEHEKEVLFTKRIYHAHHKAEKIMGFIKEEIRGMETGQAMDEAKYRVMKYSNFVSRVIYDMKTYEPPIHVIRNRAFQTDLNEVIQFIVEHIFIRQNHPRNHYEFALHLDEDFPVLHINEYVIWEIVEPLIQNAIDHNPDQEICITISTEYDADSGNGSLRIQDNGKGIPASMLHENEHGVKTLFLEHASTKDKKQTSGYGCYIAYEISRRRCDWQLDADNLPNGGAQFTITIPIANPA